MNHSDDYENEHEGVFMNEALSQILQFIEIPIQVFDEEAQRLCEIAYREKKIHNKTVASMNFDESKNRTILRYPSPIGPDASPEAYRVFSCQRFLMAWAIGEIFRGGTMILVSSDRTLANPLSCKVFDAAQACIK